MAAIETVYDYKSLRSPRWDKSGAQSSQQLRPDRSVLGKFHRRSGFFVQYLHASVYSNAVERLLPIIQTSFDHPWVAGVQLQIRCWPGKVGGWPWNRDHERSMHWDAPITVSVFRKRRASKRLALCLSGYLRGNTLYIKQLQGVTRTHVPKDLRGWPKLFMTACRTFAHQEGLRGVRVAKASSLYSYHFPFINTEASPASREMALDRIRTNMEVLYDANALDLGFVSDGIWLTWLNPSCPVRPKLWSRSLL
jgi:hypothetical protein